MKHINHTFDQTEQQFEEITELFFLQHNVMFVQEQMDSELRASNYSNESEVNSNDCDWAFLNRWLRPDSSPSQVQSVCTSSRCLCRIYSLCCLHHRITRFYYSTQLFISFKRSDVLQKGYKPTINHKDWRFSHRSPKAEVKWITGQKWL